MRFSPDLLLLIVLVAILFYPTVEGFVFPSDPLLAELQRQLSVLHPRFESVVLNEGDKSYTINKKNVYICLKDKNNRYYNRNHLVYVICHEYSHILCDEVGHTPKFFKIFEGVLDKAAKQGLYNPSIPPLREYCGVTY